MMLINIASVHDNFWGSLHPTEIEGADDAPLSSGGTKGGGDRRQHAQVNISVGCMSGTLDALHALVQWSHRLRVQHSSDARRNGGDGHVPEKRIPPGWQGECSIPRCDYQRELAQVFALGNVVA